MAETTTAKPISTARVVGVLRKAGLTASKTTGDRWYRTHHDGFTVTQMHSGDGVWVHWRSSNHAVSRDGIAECLRLLAEGGLNARIMGDYWAEVHEDGYPWPDTAMDAPTFARHVAVTALRRRVEEAEAARGKALDRLDEVREEAEARIREAHRLVAELAALEGGATE